MPDCSICDQIRKTENEKFKAFFDNFYGIFQN